MTFPSLCTFSPYLKASAVLAIDGREDANGLKILAFLKNQGERSPFANARASARSFSSGCPLFVKANSQQDRRLTGTPELSDNPAPFSDKQRLDGLFVLLLWLA